MTHQLSSFLFAALGLVASSAAAAQTVAVHCESRNYQRAYCSTGPITGAQIVTQISGAPCVQGRTWGWDGNGIWVSDGCEGDFTYQPAPSGPPPAQPVQKVIDCESREYQQSYCRAGSRIARAWVAEQHSQAPCIEGRTWGWDNDGVWVNQGCAAVFGYEIGGAEPPPPPPPASPPPPPASPPAASIVCESVEYRQSWCGTGTPLRRVWVAEQRSQAPCIEGQTWGWNERSVWVSGGCAAVFSFE